MYVLIIANIIITVILAYMLVISLNDIDKDIKDIREKLEYTEREDIPTYIKRTKPNFKNPLKPYDVTYDKYKNGDGLYEPQEPKR